jgi:DNA modification methylase
MAKKSDVKPAAPARLKSSALLDTRAIYCGDNLEQLSKLPEACVDLIYIDPPFNSNRNYEVFWGEMMREDCDKGFFVAFDFSVEALTEISQFFKRTGKMIIPLTVREILEEEISRELA